MSKTKKANPIPAVSSSGIEEKIRTIRGHRIMLDSDLASLYGVETKNLNRAVSRNKDRFPDDFMFRITKEEAELLRCQNGTSKNYGKLGDSEKSDGRGGRRYLPYAFTEHGVLMAANVLRSSQAMAVSVEIVRAFVRLRSVVAVHGDLARKIAEVEKQFEERLNNHDEQLATIQEILLPLLSAIEPPKRKIGFKPDEEGDS